MWSPRLHAVWHNDFLSCYTTLRWVRKSSFESDILISLKLCFGSAYVQRETTDHLYTIRSLSFCSMSKDSPVMQLNPHMTELASSSSTYLSRATRMIILQESCMPWEAYMLRDETITRCKTHWLTFGLGQIQVGGWNGAIIYGRLHAWRLYKPPPCFSWGFLFRKEEACFPLELGSELILSFCGTCSG